MIIFVHCDKERTRILIFLHFVLRVNNSISVFFSAYGSSSRITVSYGLPPQRRLPFFWMQPLQHAVPAILMQMRKTGATHICSSRFTFISIGWRRVARVEVSICVCVWLIDIPALMISFCVVNWWAALPFPFLSHSSYSQRWRAASQTHYSNSWDITD